jgi:dTDP-4-amino-4,6-dideoxygalactose transaminase
MIAAEPATSSIGGAFELDVESLFAAPRVPATLPGETVTSGRTALALVAQRHADGGKWLVPAYLCESVLQGLRLAAADIAFYSVGADLTVQPDALLRAVAEARPAAVLLVDYFGFPPMPEAAAAFRDLRGRCLVVEDCAHGSLLETPAAAAGTIGDVAFTSFRKYLPLPDGGVLIGSEGESLPPARGPHVSARLLGQLLRGAFARGVVGGDEIERGFLAAVEAGEAALDDQVPLEAMSEVGRRLLAGLDLADVCVRRRLNFATLHTLVAGLPVQPLRAELPAGVSPLVYPVRIDGGRRNAVRAALAARRIFCPVHWPLPPEIDRARFADEHRLADEMLGLPVDQRYDGADMERIAGELASALGTR